MTMHCFKEERRTYKDLYTTFLCQFCFFILCLTTSAAIFQAVEPPYASDLGVNQATAAGDVRLKVFLQKFGAEFNISTVELTRFHKSILQNNGNGSSNHILYIEGCWLALSAFTTIGWESHFPVSGNGKCVIALSICIGAPLTLFLVMTGAHIMKNHARDLITLFSSNNRRNTRNNNRYSDHKLHLEVEAFTKPVLFVSLLTHVMLTSAIISFWEDFQYSSSMWFVFSTLSTIGFGGGEILRRMFHGGGDNAGEIVGIQAAAKICYLLFWVVFGYSNMVAILWTTGATNKLRLRKSPWTLKKPVRNLLKIGNKKKQAASELNTGNATSETIALTSSHS